MKYFYIDNIKFNYNFEFDNQNSKSYWKYTISLIEYFETIGINIPHYCYHKNLSIAGNCRMCLIELKKSPKPVVSCAMNAKSSLAANTEVFTNSPLVRKARENIMEFLLLNHPLDCPVCDQGGDCDLQEQSLFFGITKKRFYNFKRIVTDKNLGPIVKTIMTRCIHCTKCVRFAEEIAGIEDLGVFGRGSSTEIGTYINKTFQSELSGNIIDICPVGALTSKPYPFTTRSWELKKINTIDPSDSFGLNIQVYLKNNKVIKILPGYPQQNENNTNQWISNKSRFFFDSMFSSNRNVNKILIVNNTKTVLTSWSTIFKKLIVMIYFIDHLEKHKLKINFLVVIFDENSSVEILGILLLLKKKYPFLKLRKAIDIKIANDFESNLQTNNASNYKTLINSNICLLVGTNIRYENPNLNLKLKKRFRMGNFQVFAINSYANATFPMTTIGSNSNRLKLIVQGNSTLCTNLKTSENIITILNSNAAERKDAYTVLNLAQNLNNYYSNTNHHSNLLNTSLNSVGINFLSKFKSFCKKDLEKASGLFFIGSNSKTDNINEKLVELELLNYCSKNNSNLFLIEQNYRNSYLNIKNKLTIVNYFYLPTNTFFEECGNYITADGEFKRSDKIISSMLNTKSNWQILRKLNSALKKIKFANNVKQNTRIIYNSTNILNFKNLMSFLFLSTKSLSKLSFHLKTKNQRFAIIRNQKNKKSKLLFSQMKKEIEDFYLGGLDNYCKESETMITCSISLRMNTATFE